jgi:hypothetical protein
MASILGINPADTQVYCPIERQLPIISLSRESGEPRLTSFQKIKSFVRGLFTPRYTYAVLSDKTADIQPSRPDMAKDQYSGELVFFQDTPRREGEDSNKNNSFRFFPDEYHLAARAKEDYSAKTQEIFFSDDKIVPSNTTTESKVTNPNRLIAEPSFEWPMSEDTLDQLILVIDTSSGKEVYSKNTETRPETIGNKVKAHRSNLYFETRQLYLSDIVRSGNLLVGASYKKGKIKFSYDQGVLREFAEKNDVTVDYARRLARKEWIRQSLELTSMITKYV